MLDRSGLQGPGVDEEGQGEEVKPLKVGDRVRIKAGRRIPRYQSGDRGTVWRGPVTSAAGTAYYLLTMDRDGGRNTIFTTNEIEPDG
jgi:hypothetical protein